ncbi:MAG: hypothetical protein FWF29_05750 [Treponema sp.]|nr:hypothetical protein [Treponema sp.]
MDKQINFDDNIFILNAEIRLISDILRLDADAALFLEKTAGDIGFIDRTLSVLMKSLTANTMLLDREEELSKLADLEWRFDQLAAGIRGNTGIIAALNAGTYRDTLAQYRNNSIQRRRTIENSYPADHQNESEPVVSSFELNQLLQEL